MQATVRIGHSGSHVFRMKRIEHEQVTTAFKPAAIGYLARHASRPNCTIAWSTSKRDLGLAGRRLAGDGRDDDRQRPALAALVREPRPCRISPSARRYRPARFQRLTDKAKRRPGKGRFASRLAMGAEYALSPTPAGSPVTNPDQAREGRIKRSRRQSRAPSCASTAAVSICWSHPDRNQVLSRRLPCRRPAYEARILGRWPGLTVEQARAARDAIRQTVRDGGGHRRLSGCERTIARIEANAATVRVVIERWLKVASGARSWSATYKRDVEVELANHILPVIGDRSIGLHIDDEIEALVIGLTIETDRAAGAAHVRKRSRRARQLDLAFRLCGELRSRNRQSGAEDRCGANLLRSARSLATKSASPRACRDDRSSAERSRGDAKATRMLAVCQAPAAIG